MRVRAARVGDLSVEVVRAQGPSLTMTAISVPQTAIYLTADQVADLLQVSRSTVFRLAKADPTMPALRLGGVIRFPKDRLLTWLRQREQGPVAHPRASKGLKIAEATDDPMQEALPGHMDGHKPADSGGGGTAKPRQTRGLAAS